MVFFFHFKKYITHTIKTHISNEQCRRRSVEYINYCTEQLRKGCAIWAYFLSNYMSDQINHTSGLNGFDHAQTKIIYFCYTQRITPYSLNKSIKQKNKQVIKWNNSILSNILFLNFISRSVSDISILMVLIDHLFFLQAYISSHCAVAEVRPGLSHCRGRGWRGGLFHFFRSKLPWLQFTWIAFTCGFFFFYW